jgi:pilus assembly protein TadC
MKIKDDGNISKLEFVYALEMLSSLMKAGGGIFEGIKYYQPTISGQLAREFLTLINEEKIGLDQAEIFANFANRLKTPATHRFAYLIL